VATHEAAGFSSPFPRKASTEPKPPSSQAGASFEERVFPEGDIFNASPWLGPVSYCSTYNTKNTEGKTLLRWATPQGRTGATEEFRLPEVLYDDWFGHRTGGSRGSGQGYYPLSTQRATRSPRVFAWLLEPVFLPLIHSVFRSSKSL
jgi:hypothetical protein